MHQIAEKILDLHKKWIDSFLDPLLLMPILFHFILWEKRTLFKKESSYTLSGIEVFIWWVAISILTEYLFPKWNKGFTADLWDILCYGLGSLFFFLFMNQPQLRTGIQKTKT